MHQTRSNVKTHVNATTIHALNLLRNRKIVLFKPFGEAKFFQVLIYSKSFFSLTGKLWVTAAYFFVLLGLFLNFLQLVCVCGCMWVYVCVCMCVEGSGLGGRIPINFGKVGYLPHPFQQGAKPTICYGSALPPRFPSLPQVLSTASVFLLLNISSLFRKQLWCKAWGVP